MVKPVDRCEICGGLRSTDLALEYDVAECQCEPEGWGEAYRDMYEDEETEVGDG